MGDQGARSVVVGVDGSEAASDAVRWAADEAARSHLPLRLVAAVEWVTPHRIGATGLEPPDVREAVVTTAEGWLADARILAEDAASPPEVQTQVRGGTPAAVLHQESADAQLVVVGHRGRGRVSGLLSGSVAVAVAASARCPVVVVRGTATANGPVVVGVDGSMVSEAALSYAFATASARRARLVAVHVWNDSTVDTADWALRDRDAIEATEHEVLAERLAGWSEKYPDVAIEPLIVRDDPASVLVDHAATAQLVVVGSRGRGSVRGTLLGSVSQALLRRANCPVAVVRP
ncbi:UspA domain-containing protein [Pseudonocardia dioxanivorans CB1190]|uniref:UspA domain-containing protein n=1 Tax=Pseudonocardia dioxanivorans (strain ATCC 55486 / DSM 44775 / JCM 13855 / CB1190) TaxID=675635 RepID=F4CJW2_PSEUX|nr:universal stress protein [Pseudonocardia dioxanivorans]AEA26987.1 UspA domain-containing protein [Pseudonocardia dioxanivorans CB1190]